MNLPLHVDAYQKLFIVDIHCSLFSRKDSGREPRKVCVMGSIVSIKRYQERTLYEVDDGTGIIMCSLWNKKEDTSLEIQNLKDELVLESLTTASVRNGLEKILHKIEKSQNDEESYVLGNLVCILGSVKEIHSKLQINVHHHKRIDDPNIETQSILEQLLLYRYVY